MSLTYRVIGLSDLAQVPDLLERGFGEAASAAKQHSLSVNWQEYQRLAQAGVLYICGCFAGSELVGFVGMVKLLDLWGLNGYVASVVTIYLHPSYRKGFNGYRLIRYAEKLALATGCIEIRLPVSSRSKNHRGKPRTNLFANLGYRLREVVFAKRL